MRVCASLVTPIALYVTTCHATLVSFLPSYMHAYILSVASSSSCLFLLSLTEPWGLLLSSMAGKRPIGSAPVKYDRSRVPAPRRREASLSEEAVPSERSCAHSEEADREEEEQEEQSPRSSPTEDAREPLADAPASPLPPTKKRTKKDPRSSRNDFVHTFEEPGRFAAAMIKAGQRTSRGKGHGRSRSGGNRHRRRASGASASSGLRDPPRGASAPLVPCPPACPPPPAMRKVTLHANTDRHAVGEDANASQVPVPPPPPGPTPEEHLRTALAFMRSLHDLERDAAAVRGTLEPIKQLVGIHIMNLRNQFRLVL